MTRNHVPSNLKPDEYCPVIKKIVSSGQTGADRAALDWAIFHNFRLYLSRSATLSMVFKLAQHAQKHWRKLNGHALLLKVLQAVRFEDGIEQTQAPTNQEIAA
jgi:hypothetical protein